MIFGLTRAAVTTAKTLAVLAILAVAPARAAPSDVPIEQDFDGTATLRYAVWVKVGDRVVQALLDTGSTGLRVLPTVVPGDLEGLPSDPVFGGKIHMGGIVITKHVEIGDLSGSVPIEVIDHIDCVQTNPDCAHTKLDVDTFLIGGDGRPAHGYSAILGIGFSSRSHDVPNPLEALGAKRWSVALPRPSDDAAGHLLIDPSDAEAGSFTPVARAKHGDFRGCLMGPDQFAACGDTLLDTGALLVRVRSSDIQKPAIWPDGSTARLHIAGSGETELKTDFVVGSGAGQPAVALSPAAASEPTHINAGLYPFFTYDVLYDAARQGIGLRKRPRVPLAEAHAPDGAAMDSGSPPEASRTSAGQAQQGGPSAGIVEERAGAQAKPAARRRYRHIAHLGMLIR